MRGRRFTAEATGAGPLIAIAMDIRPRHVSAHCKAYVLARVLPLLPLPLSRKCGRAARNPSRRVRRQRLKVELPMRGPCMAAPLCQHHHSGRHKLTLLWASGLERLAAPRPGCDFNNSDVSKSVVADQTPNRTRSTRGHQSASNASTG